MIEGYKTIGEVAKETGLPVREIKYYVERGIVSPSKKYCQGNKKYNLYSDADIIKIQQIALYRELGYSRDQIKEIISNPDFNWKEALDSQVSELRALKKHIENKIIVAEFIRMIFQEENENDLDISDFGNNIDSFVTDIFSPESEENTETALMKATGDALDNVSLDSLEEIGKAGVETYEILIFLMDRDPREDFVQNEFAKQKSKVKNLLEQAKVLKPDYLNENPIIGLFMFRVVSTLSIERIINMFFQDENALEFIEIMMEEHISRAKKEEENG